MLVAGQFYPVADLRGDAAALSQPTRPVKNSPDSGAGAFTKGRNRSFLLGMTWDGRAVSIDFAVIDPNLGGWVDNCKVACVAG
jgi:hypothetical protein